MFLSEPADVGARLGGGGRGRGEGGARVVSVAVRRVAGTDRAGHAVRGIVSTSDCQRFPFTSSHSPG